MSSSSEFRLAVLNPKGRDAFLDYTRGVGAWRAGVHAPINFHAYAAATKGAFFDSAEALARDDRFPAVLLLIRHRTFVSLEAARRLKQAGKTLLVSWKECGPYQIAEQLGCATALQDYAEILDLADGILSPTLVPPPRWGWISVEEFRRKLRFIPTPYAVDLASWDYSLPVENRAGILVGTREFLTPTRNHLRALAEIATLASELKVPVTVINGDKRLGMRMLHSLEESFPEASLHIVERPLTYGDYLRLMARHKLVFHLDRGSVPGQVAGDALLCRTLCAGGNSAVEKVAFPGLSDDGSGNLESIYANLRRLFADKAFYDAEVAASQSLAAEHLSFAAAAKQLERFVAEVG